MLGIEVSIPVRGKGIKTHTIVNGYWQDENGVSIPVRGKGIKTF